MTSNKRKIILIISVCLELMWGYINTNNYTRIKMLINDTTHGKQVVEELLKLFNKYGIPVTWATVGGLFLEKHEIDEILNQMKLPVILKEYNKLKIDNMLYGKDLIEKIISSNINHEIGYHTFTHTVLAKCSEDVAELEIRRGVEVAKKEFGLHLQSFVFPENKICYLNLLKKYGFKVFRGENIWRLKESTFRGRLFNSILANKVIPWREYNGLLKIPTSMLFDNPVPLPILKAVNGIEWGENGYIFHISMHPESILTYRNSLKLQLELFLKYVARKVNQRKIDVLTMGELPLFGGEI